MLPKKSGWEVCQALKAMQRTADIAVVLSTARGDVKDRLTGLQLGADDYLVKPFNRDEVVKRIGTLLDRRRRAAAPPETPARLTENMLFDRATGLPTVAMVLDRLKEILIDQDGTPVAKLTRSGLEVWPCQPGSARHLPHWIAPDFDATPEDFREYTE